MTGKDKWGAGVSDHDGARGGQALGGQPELGRDQQHLLSDRPGARHRGRRLDATPALCRHQGARDLRQLRTRRVPTARLVVALKEHETHELDVARRLQPSGDRLVPYALHKKVTNADDERSTMLIGPWMSKPRRPSSRSSSESILSADSARSAHRRRQSHADSAHAVRATTFAVRSPRRSVVCVLQTSILRSSTSSRPTAITGASSGCSQPVPRVCLAGCVRNGLVRIVATRCEGAPIVVEHKSNRVERVGGGRCRILLAFSRTVPATPRVAGLEEIMRLALEWGVSPSARQPGSTIGESQGPVAQADSSLLGAKAFEFTICWDAFFIRVPLRRALRGLDRAQSAKERFRDDSIQNDWNGSAKLALISIERSVLSWRLLGRGMEDDAWSM